MQKKTLNSNKEFRIEHDTLGEVQVPKTALYGAQTQRATENFPISGKTLTPTHIQSLARIKKAAAITNTELNIVPPHITKAIIEATEEIISGKHQKEFPVDIFQTGSGTSSNMNMNEVIANLANQKLPQNNTQTKIHPNDHVNASQSSNDVFPTSVHIACSTELNKNLIPTLEHLAKTLENKSTEFAEIVKAGRTHLMDATPVTLGQEFQGYATQIRYGIKRIQTTLPRVNEIPLGGTAVGTGINTPNGFSQKVIKLLAQETKLPLTEATNHFEAQANRDGLVEASAALKTIAVSLTKINNDLRWMGSGPNTGLGEINLPDLQPGSSIMPGKVNPVIPEAVLMVCAQIIGNDATITWAGASGSFELNVSIPIIGYNLLESITLLNNACQLLANKTIKGITANIEKTRFLAESSPAIVTPLNKILGYEQAAKIAKYAIKNNVTIHQAVKELGYVERKEITEQQLTEALNILAMTKPTPK